MEKVNINVQKAAKACEVKKVEGAAIKGAGNGTTGGIRPIDPIVVPKEPRKPIRNPGIAGGERALKDVKIKK